jgi:hypothetical protein
MRTGDSAAATTLPCGAGVEICRAKRGGVGGAGSAAGNDAGVTGRWRALDSSMPAPTASSSAAANAILSGGPWRRRFSVALPAGLG